MTKRSFLAVNLFAGALVLVLPLASLAAERPPFVLQAPDGKWNAVSNEMCEEAAALMAYRWYKRNAAPVSPAVALRAFALLRGFEKKNFGTFDDTTLGNTLSIMKDWFEIPEKHLRALDGGTAEGAADLNPLYEALAAGEIIIFPADGKKLRNPHFRNGGPKYHHLLLYAADREKGVFYANDSGTRHGAGFNYSAATIADAWHDWTGKKADGARTALAVKRPPVDEKAQ